MLRHAAWRVILSPSLVILSEAKNLALKLWHCEILRRLRLLRMTVARGGLKQWHLDGLRFSRRDYFAASARFIIVSETVVSRDRGRSTPSCYASQRCMARPDCVSL